MKKVIFMIMAVLATVLALSGCGLDKKDDNAVQVQGAYHLDVTPKAFKLAKGGSIAIAARLLDGADNLIVGTDEKPVVITWRSGNVGVATVGEDGDVTGAGTGSAVITAETTYDGKALTVQSTVTVEFSDMKALNLSPSRISLDLAGSRDFVVSATDGTGFPTTTDCIGGMTFEYDGTYISEVKKAGSAVTVKGKQKGYTLLTAYCGGFASTPAVIEVKPPVEIPAPSSDSDFGIELALATHQEDIHISSYDQYSQKLVYTFFRDIWSSETIDGEGDYGRKSSIILDPSRNYQPVICAIEGSYLSCWLRMDGGNWTKRKIEQVTTSAGSYNGRISMAVNDAGEMTILYYDKTEDALKLATSQMFSRNDWSISTVIKGGGRFSSLALNSEGNPRIALQFDNKAYYGAPGTNGWVFETIDDSIGSGTGIILKIGTDNRPQVVYFKKSMLVHSIKEDGMWARSVVENVDAGIDYIAGFALDRANLARVSYYDASHQTLRYASRLRKERSGLSTRWRIESPDASGDDAGIYNALVVDRYHRGQIAYYDYKLRRIRYYVEPHFLDYVLPPSVSTDSDSNEDVTAPILLNNHSPAASDMTLSTNAGSSVAVALSATDPDGDVVTCAVVSDPANGTLSGTTPNLSYLPKSGFSGKDELTYICSDGKADSGIAKVTINVGTTPAVITGTATSGGTSTPPTNMTVTQVKYYEVEPNDTFATAFQATFGNEYIGHRNGTEYVDVYRVKAVGSSMTVTLSHVSKVYDSNFSIYVYNYDGQEMDNFSANRGVDNKTILGVIPGATYFIKVNLGNVSSTYEYSLKIN